MTKLKQGEHKEITTKDPDEFKNKEIIKKDWSSVLTIKDGKPLRKYFQDGKLVLTEEVKK